MRPIRPDLLQIGQCFDSSNPVGRAAEATCAVSSNLGASRTRCRDCGCGPAHCAVVQPIVGYRSDRMEPFGRRRPTSCGSVLSLALW